MGLFLIFLIKSSADLHSPVYLWLIFKINLLSLVLTNNGEDLAKPNWPKKSNKALSTSSLMSLAENFSDEMISKTM